MHKVLSTHRIRPSKSQALASLALAIFLLPRSPAGAAGHAWVLPSAGPPGEAVVPSEVLEGLTPSSWERFLPYVRDRALEDLRIRYGPREGRRRYVAAVRPLIEVTLGENPERVIQEELVDRAFLDPEDRSAFLQEQRAAVEELVESQPLDISGDLYRRILEYAATEAPRDYVRRLEVMRRELVTWRKAAGHRE